MLKPKTTSRKFYNKWIYKISLKLPGVAVFRNYDLSAVPSIPFEKSKNVHSLMYKASTNKNDIINLSQFLLQYSKDSWHKRIERDSIDLYTNDLEFFHQVLNNFSKLVKGYSVPKPTEVNTLLNTDSILAKKLPFNKYRYKVFLAPHKIRSMQAKAEFIGWLKSQENRVKISDTVKRWFITTNWNWDRRYMLVEDEKTLLLLKLRLPDAIGRVYDYILTDK